jgi:hypothetical protein
MDIKGLDYNTAREKLVMTEYGREIQRMIDVAIALPDKEERMRCAYAIIHQMEMKNPQVREGEDYQQTLWDHLYLMSRKQLDIDWPYDMSEAENILAKPAPMKHPSPNGQSRMPPSARKIMEVFERLKTMPEGVERDELVRLTANQMKRDLMTWSHGSVDDEKVADDLARFTDGKIQLDLSTFRFDHIDAVVPDSGNGKRKKKK